MFDDIIGGANDIFGLDAGASFSLNGGGSADAGATAAAAQAAAAPVLSATLAQAGIPQSSPLHQGAMQALGLKILQAAPAAAAAAASPSGYNFAALPPPSVSLPSSMVAASSQITNQNQAAFVRNLAARHAAAVVPRPATKAREYPLGFPTTSLTTAAATQTVSTQPQVPFRGRRLIVPSDIAGSILINDLKVGKNSMFATANPVPARGFTEFGVGVDLNLDTAQISQLISLNVTNTSGATISFNAMLIGTAVE